MSSAKKGKMVGTALCAFAHPTALSMPPYSAGFSSRRIGGSSCKVRLARRSAIRSIIWRMTPRGFFAAAAVGTRRTGGEIFSNVNAGIVCPLAVEMNHLLEFPCHPDEAQLPHPFTPLNSNGTIQAQSMPDATRMRPDCGLVPMILK
nr:hypothetical protein [Bradyrhizobium sp. AC87j1]